MSGFTQYKIQGGILGLVEGGSETMEQGTVWRIQLFDFGNVRGTDIWLTREAAEASLPIMEGMKVYMNRVSDRAGHQSDPLKKSPHDIVGSVHNLTINENGVEGDLVLLPSAGRIRQDLLFSFNNQMPPPWELSIDAGAEEGQTIVVSGTTYKAPTKFTRIAIDFVERGAAGGRVMRLVASEVNQPITNNQPKGKQEMKQSLLLLFSMLYPTYLAEKGVDTEKIDENALFSHLLAADKATPRMHLPDGATLTAETLASGLSKAFAYLAETSAGETVKAALASIKDSFTTVQASAKSEPSAELLKEIHSLKVSASDAKVQQLIQASALPEPLANLVAKEFMGKVADVADVTARIKETREAYGKLNPASVNNGGLDVRAGLDAKDKVLAGIEGFFLDGSLQPLSGEEKSKLQPYKSIRAAYVDYTGDTNVTGFKTREQMSVLGSLQTGDWAQVVADAMNKRLVRDYVAMSLDGWKQFVDIVPVSDFKTQHRIRYGGYGNLPSVSQAAPYLPLTSPTDEEATYTPAKYGGTEDVSRELILNDDVRAVRNIPARMAAAAARTLHEFVLDFIRPGNTTESVGTPVTIYDSTALYTTAHGNKATTALGTDGVAMLAARLAMLKQTDMSSTKRLGIEMGFLVVPVDLEDEAYKNITNAYGESNQVPEFHQQLGIRVVLAPFWTDATDWCAVASRRSGVGLEVGFVGGQETPELFVSDVANVGSWFTNDKITYKIRHEYGGAITDFRFFHGSVVA